MIYVLLSLLSGFCFELSYLGWLYLADRGLPSRMVWYLLSQWTKGVSWVPKTVQQNTDSSER